MRQSPSFDDFLAWLGDILTRLLIWLSWRLRIFFARLSLFGKGVALAGLLYAADWLAFRLGLRGLGAELGHLAWTVLSIVLTGAIIAHIWTRFTRPSRYGGFTRR